MAAEEQPSSGSSYGDRVGGVGEELAEDQLVEVVVILPISPWSPKKKKEMETR
jgi:hypothetical protein